jgi:branched-chain amino acid transport system substrate-binding protein
MSGRRAFLGVVAVVVLVSGWLGPGSSSGAREPVKIGAVLSVTGPAAFLGGPERNTLDALVEQVNKAGGIRGAPVELVVYDDASDTSKAVLATRRLIEQDRVLAIVGPSTSNSALAVLPFAERSKVPLLAIAVHKEISTPVKPWVFQVANVIDQEIGKILDYLKKRHLSRFAIINVSDARGVTGKDELVRQAPAYGMTVSAIQAFGPDDVDVTPQLTRIRSTDAQAVVCVVSSSVSAIVAKNFRQLGMTQPLVMGTGFANIKFVQLAGDAANGIVFPGYKIGIVEELPAADPMKPVILAYKREYEARFNEPANIFGAFAHDAFGMLKLAIEQAPDVTRASVRDALERRPRPFTGASGIYAFSPTDHNGFLLDGLVMHEVRGQKFTLAK